MDIELYYREAGSGEPLIMLHGNGESGEYFINQIEHFQSRYRVIAPDTRGHGRSPRGEAPFTIAQFANDLYDFMQGLGIARAAILGFSDGANIAMKFAMQHPEMVKALILNGGNLDPSGVKRTAQFPIEIGYKIACRFAAKSPSAKKNAEMLGLMVNDPNISPLELAKLTMPTLVVCGTKDMIRESHTRMIAENIPNARLVILPGDHFVANKHPAEFNQVVDDFLESVGSIGTTPPAGPCGPAGGVVSSLFCLRNGEALACPFGAYRPAVGAEYLCAGGGERCEELILDLLRRRDRCRGIARRCLRDEL